MRYCIQYAGLPLAIYREVAAHLSQVEGVQVELVSQQAQQFDYDLSQIGSVCIQLSDPALSTSQHQVQQILAYYSDRYGAWEAIDPGTISGPA